MSVGELCNRNVIVAYKSLVLSEAARLMRHHHVGSLVVVEETDRGRLPVGMVTDRDIVVEVVAADRDARNVSVADAMTADPATLREGDSLVDALQLMRRRGVRRVPVVADSGALVGILTIDDLLDTLGRQLAALAGAIQIERGHEARTRD